MSDESNQARLLRALLRPAARFCLRHSLGIKELSEVAKLALLDVAEEEMQSRFEKVNASRLSVMTGVHRKDVSRFSREDARPITAKSRVSKVIGQWCQDRDFMTKSGSPRVLTYDSDESDFTELVRRVTRDVSPKSVLFELQRLGAVSESKGRLRLEVDAAVFQLESDEGYELLAKDVHDLSSAVEYNLSPEKGTSHLHARTEYDRIPLRDIKKVKDWIRKEGSAFHRKVRKFLANFDLDIKGGKDVAVGRVSLTTFSFTEEEKGD